MFGILCFIRFHVLWGTELLHVFLVTLNKTESSTGLDEHLPYVAPCSAGDEVHQLQLFGQLS